VGRPHIVVDLTMEAMEGKQQKYMAFHGTPFTYNSQHIHLHVIIKLITFKAAISPV